MKTCPNCRVVHRDEYNGQCNECGAPLGGIASTNQGEMAFRFARQVQGTRTETQMEERLKRGQYQGLKFDGGLMEVARAGAYLLEKAAGRDVSAWEE